MRETKAKQEIKSLLIEKKKKENKENTQPTTNAGASLTYVKCFVSLILGILWLISLDIVV